MNPKNNHIDPIEDDITTLFEELQLASRWQRPSILLAAYRSKLVFIDAQICLEKKLRKLKQTVFHLDVNQENYDIPMFLSQYPERDRTIFFVSGLHNGGGPTDNNAYRALNIRRELLVDHQIRAVFWLNEEEADALPSKALDFWSFRHRMVELTEEPTPKRVFSLVKSLNWPYWNAAQLSKELPNAVTLREDLLNEIPDWKEAPNLRAELIHMLAALHWARQEYTESKKLLELGLGITQNNSLSQLQARYYVAIGMVAHSMGFFERAVDAYQTSLKLDPTSADAWDNLGLAYRMLQRSPEALSATNKSIESNPKLANPWKNLGILYQDSLRIDEAILAYKQSLQLDSQDAHIWTRLGDLYTTLQRPADALTPYKKAKDLNTKNPQNWLNLGLVYRELGLINNAIRAYYKAARLGPTSAIPWKNLGDIYRSNKRLKYARKAYKTASSLDPKDKDITYSLDACYTRKQK